MHAVTVDEAQARLAELMDEVERGEDVVITRDNAPSVRLVPATRPGFGSCKGQIIVSDDFDAPLDEFAEYMP
jgi:prevent-host-death family protein